MGEYAEERIDKMIWGGVPSIHIDRYSVVKWDYGRPGEQVWETKDGTQIKFSEMTQSHRTACVRLIVRNHGDWDSPTCRALIAVGIDPQARKDLGIPDKMPEYEKRYIQRRYN